MSWCQFPAQWLLFIIHKETGKTNQDCLPLACVCIYVICCVFTSNPTAWWRMLTSRMCSISSLSGIRVGVTQAASSTSVKASFMSFLLQLMYNSSNWLLIDAMLGSLSLKMMMNYGWIVHFKRTSLAILTKQTWDEIFFVPAFINAWSGQEVSVLSAGLSWLVAGESPQKPQI